MSDITLELYLTNSTENMHRYDEDPQKDNPVSLYLRKTDFNQDPPPDMLFVRASQAIAELSAYDMAEWISTHINTSLFVDTEVRGTVTAGEPVFSDDEGGRGFVVLFHPRDGRTQQKYFVTVYKEEE